MLGKLPLKVINQYNSNEEESGIKYFKWDEYNVNKVGQ